MYQNSRLLKESWYSYLYNSLGSVSHSYQLQNGGNPPEIQVPKCQPRPTSQAGLSKDSSLRPAMLTLFWTFPNCKLNTYFKITRVKEKSQENKIFSIRTMEKMIISDRIICFVPKKISSSQIIIRSEGHS